MMIMKKGDETIVGGYLLYRGIIGLCHSRFLKFCGSGTLKQSRFQWECHGLQVAYRDCNKAVIQRL